jgi:FixJ family two-component response regulator
MTKITPIIHVVDDDPSFRMAISDLLAACNYRVALHESAEQLLENPPLDEPACILLDVHMTGMSGPELQDRLADIGSKSPIVYVTGHGDIPTTVRAIKAGAEDFLTKPVSKQQLLTAIISALGHSETTRERDKQIGALRLLVSRLTAREYEVFAHLVQGKPHKKIAHALGTSERTIKFHRHNVLEKLQAHSLAELAIIAERLGLFSKASDSDPDGTHRVHMENTRGDRGQL